MPSSPVPACVRCGAPRAGGFCTQCGAAGGAPVRQRSSARMFGAWASGLAVLVVIVALVVPSKGTMPSGEPDSTGTSFATTPRGQFQQLVSQVSAAADAGNTAMVRELSQRALATYASIPPADRDVDGRYHAAMLKAVAGDLAGALAEADTILSLAPGNLLGYYVQGAAARLMGNSEGVRQSSAEFRARYQEEMAKSRPEYTEHRELLEDFFRQP